MAVCLESHTPVVRVGPMFPEGFVKMSVLSFEGGMGELTQISQKDPGNQPNLPHKKSGAC